jgi:hypothetical protein
LQSNNTVTVRNFSAPLLPPRFPSPSDPNQLARRQDWVRYIRLTSTQNFIHFREIVVRAYGMRRAGSPARLPLRPPRPSVVGAAPFFILSAPLSSVAASYRAQAFDNTWTNVIRGKPCMQSVAPYAANTGCEKGNNHVVDFDSVGSAELNDMVHTGNTNGFIEYDLGGMYQVSSIFIWNRYASIWQAGFGGNATGGANAPRLTFASMTLRNFYNETLFTRQLAPVAVTYHAFTYTSPSASPTPTGSAPASATASAAATPLESASLPPGADPSITPSASATAAPTKLPLPIGVRIRTDGSTIPLTFVQVQAWTPSGKLLTVNTSAVTSSSGGVGEAKDVPLNGCLDVYTTNACPFFLSNPSEQTANWWQAVWTTPSQVSYVILYARSGFQSRLTTVATFVELLNQVRTRRRERVSSATKQQPALSGGP